MKKRGQVFPRASSPNLGPGAHGEPGWRLARRVSWGEFLVPGLPTAREFHLTLVLRARVVVPPLFASIGAAGIPSADLAMMRTLQITPELPLEGDTLLSAMDRSLDMPRTLANVWPDSPGVAAIACTEGEEGPPKAGVAS